MTTRKEALRSMLDVLYSTDTEDARAALDAARAAGLIREATNDNAPRGKLPTFDQLPTLPEGWQRHPVTGWPVKPPAGQDVRDLIPWGRDPKMLSKVRGAMGRHGRIGAANAIVWLRSIGKDAGGYARRLSARAA